MYIIPQEIENEAKNLLKNKLSNIFSNITDSFLYSIFNVYNNKYINTITSLEEDIRNLALNIISESISIIDDLYCKSPERKKNFYINKSTAKRSIITIFGELQFERNYYESKDRNDYFYFIDSLFHFPKYNHYDVIVKGLAISNTLLTNQNKSGIITGNTISSLKDRITSPNINQIPRQSVYNWIKDWNIPHIEYSPINHKDELYVMVDEKYIHEQLKKIADVPDKTTKDIVTEIINEDTNTSKHSNSKKHHNFIMPKAFVVFDGINQVNDRKSLNNRFIFLTSSKSPWKDFMDCICKVFDFNKVNVINTLSDAGSWITSGFNELKLFTTNVIINCLCEFHFKQKINRITRDNEERSKLISLVKNNDKSLFKDELIKLKKDKPNRLEKLNEYEKYILKNWNNIHNMENSKYKSSMESHISHCVASFFSSRPKAFSYRRIEDYLKLQEYSLNGIDIFSLYLNTYDNSEKLSYMQEELSFSLFDKNNSSNIPILSLAKLSPIFLALNSLAHS